MGLAALMVSQTIACKDPPVRYRCVVELVARPSAQPLMIDVTRARHGEALEASQTLDRDLPNAFIRCGEVDQGLRGSPSSSEGSGGGAR